MHNQKLVTLQHVQRGQQVGNLHLCRPAKRHQGIGSTLQSRRQAWMDKLTADAAQEVQPPMLRLLYMTQVAVASSQPILAVIIDSVNDSDMSLKDRWKVVKGSRMMVIGHVACLPAAESFIMCRPVAKRQRHWLLSTSRVGHLWMSRALLRGLSIWQT